MPDPATVAASHHAVNSTNKIVSASSSGSATTFVHDPAGNLKEGNNYDQAIEVLVKVSGEMDQRLGGDVLTSAVLDQLAKQGFK